MTPQDAAKILNIHGEITAAIVKQAYRKASSIYHPDKGGSVEMMQAVNAAYDVLKEYQGNIETNETTDKEYGDKLNAAINAVIHLEGINIEICGSWVWITGNTKEHKDIIKSAGYKWAKKKVAWYFRPSDWKSKGRGSFSMDEIRDTHGSTQVRAKQRKALQH